MPIVNHNNAPEVPWRPNYRKWLITQEGDGTTSTEASISEVGVGTGAPLHTHEDDELIVVLSGTLSVRYGDETHEVGADHTVVVPPNVPHGFTAIGDRAGENNRDVSGEGPVPSDAVLGRRAAGVGDLKGLGCAPLLLNWRCPVAQPPASQLSRRNGTSCFPAKR